MIGLVNGTVSEIDADAVLVVVGGVGYEGRPAGQAARCAIGDEVTFRVETIYRENDVTAWFFSDTSERAWFRLLIGLQGVGPRMAAALLADPGPEGLAACVSAGDGARLAKAKGVGPKTGKAIVEALKGKPLPSTGSGAAVMGHPRAAAAIDALKGLGYQAGRASDAVAAALDVLPADVDETRLLSAALKIVSTGRD